jgi:hypothetical protein
MISKFRDWTRLLPRPLICTDMERFVYLYEFLRHKKGSNAAKKKAMKELNQLSRLR